MTFQCLLPASTVTVGSRTSTGMNGQANRISLLILYKLYIKTKLSFTKNYGFREKPIFLYNLGKQLLLFRPLELL